MYVCLGEQNERFQVTSFGWSKNGLLPTDRKHISTRDGKNGWATLEVKSVIGVMLHTACANLRADNNVMQAADMAMITHGWTWTQSTWSIEQEDSPSSSSSSATDRRRSSTGVSDGEGWTYAASFGSIEASGSAVKGMTHFVRRRRRSRQQTFVGV